MPCGCTGGCNSQRCSCLKNGTYCGKGCKCKNCKNAGIHTPRTTPKINRVLSGQPQLVPSNSVTVNTLLTRFDDIIQPEIMNPPLSPPPQRDEEIDCQSTISPEEKKELIRQKIAELDQTLRDSIQLLQIQFEMSCDALNLTLASELAKLPTDTLHMKLVDFQAKFHSDPSNSLKDSIMSDISKIFAQTDPGKT